jgi:hypothetical protein
MPILDRNPLLAEQLRHWLAATSNCDPITMAAAPYHERPPDTRQV